MRLRQGRMLGSLWIIGCIPYPTEHATEGLSTVYPAQEAKALHDQVHNTETNAANIRVARAVIWARDLISMVKFHHGRGADLLKDFPDLIDSFYLDGSDEPATNLEALQAAEPKLATDATICIDDCHTYLGRARDCLLQS